ncbi:hypothetical protein AAFF_G00237220 [Aldrovandia affinis]|uniref:Uncharacterized protein n=1 Tax=Aldrovandia affinis TaxID=143900 RepID=A0AAD7REM2_9TELE|nr:hypothetical protein AAFF_G00237220 [Aldrovandia affinis]
MPVMALKMSPGFWRSALTQTRNIVPQRSSEARPHIPPGGPFITPSAVPLQQLSHSLTVYGAEKSRWRAPEGPVGRGQESPAKRKHHPTPGGALEHTILPGQGH